MFIKFRLLWEKKKPNIGQCYFNSIQILNGVETFFQWLVHEVLHVRCGEEFYIVGSDILFGYHCDQETPGVLMLFGPVHLGEERVGFNVLHSSNPRPKSLKSIELQKLSQQGFGFFGEEFGQVERCVPADSSWMT